MTEVAFLTAAEIAHKVGEGSLFLASPNLPTARLTFALRSFTALEIKFHLVTPAVFENLAAALL